VETEAAALGDLADRGDLGGAVDETIFGGVGDRQRVRLDLVDVGADAVAGGFDCLREQFRALALEQGQLRAVGEESRRAGFINLDMRVAVAQDGAFGRAQRGERETVGGGAGGHPQRADRCFEQVGESAVEAPAPRVAIIGGVEPVRLGEGVEHRRMTGGGIVGKEAHDAERWPRDATRSTRKNPGTTGATGFSTPHHETRLDQRSRNVVERRVQLRADTLHRADGRNGDERGDQAVFDRGRTLGVSDEFDKAAHIIVPFDWSGNSKVRGLTKVKTPTEGVSLRDRCYRWILS
jgi:hypothetical protein